MREDFDFGMHARLQPAVELEEQAVACKCGIALLRIERAYGEEFFLRDLF